MSLDAEQLAGLIAAQAACLQLWVRSRCESAEDVVQEAFCRLAVQVPAPDNPVAWLYRVCRNLAEKQRLTDKRRRQRESQHAILATASRETIDDVDLQETLAAVEELSSELREVVVARIWGQLSLDEIGQLCGVSTATAFRRYQAALQELRKKLAPPCEKRP